MASDLLSIASSGIYTSQVAINVTGQNISNVSSTGYVRQVVNQATNVVGQGAQVTDIERIYNDFLNSQANAAQTRSNQYDTQNNLVQPINQIIADPSSGISTAMSNFFNSLQKLSTQPSDQPNRQIVITNAQALVNSFGNLQNTFDTANANINTQLSNSVQTINSLAQQISTLNKQINATTDSNVLNGLNNQRDAVVTELSKQVKISTNLQGNSMIVSIANGIPLVDATQSQPLKIVNSAYSSDQLDVSYNGADKNSVITTNNLPGGVLGGLLEFRSGILNDTQNQIGKIALGISYAINQAQAKGFDLNGNLGQNIFNTPNNLNSAVFPNKKNTGTTVPTVSLNSTTDTNAPYLNQLTASNYTLSFDGSNYNLTRNSDGVVLANNKTGDFNNVDGMFIKVDPGIAKGDSFLISPTMFAARILQLATTDPNKIAAAGSLNAGAVNAGDNSNLMNMLNIQNSKILSNGTLTDSFNQTVSSFGIMANQIKVNSDFEDGVRNSTSQAVQNYSGVNLDEEAANLIKFQQAYQASGKVLQIAKQMFDSLITITQ